MPEHSSQMDLAQAIAPLLSREEFHAVYSIQWVGHSYGAYGVSEMSDEDRAVTFSFLGLALIFGIRKLHEAGYTFSSLRYDDSDDEVYPIAEGHVTPGNFLYIHQLAVGQPLNFQIFVQSAIAFIEEHELELDLEPLRVAEREIQEMLDFTMKNLDPERAAAIKAGKREALEIGEHFSRGGIYGVPRFGKPTDH